MRTVTLAVVLLLALSGILPAGDYYHPDSNAAKGGTISLPWGTSEIRYHALFPAAALGGKKVRIMELAFATSAAGTFASSQCEICLAHLPTSSRLSSTFDNNLKKDKTVVFSGKISWTGTQDQWSNVGLTSFFNYNGTDNIVVEVRHMSATSSISCRTGNVATVFNSGAGAYNRPTAGPLGVLAAPKMRLTYDETLLAGSGSTAPGGTVDLDLMSTPDGGLPYQLGSSFSAGPIPIDTRMLNLGFDSLLIISVAGMAPQIFEKYTGILDTSGKAKAKLHIPSWSALKGTRIYTAFVTVKSGAPSNIANISNTFMFAIM